MPPQTPAANDVIELSEIMLFKDTKGVTCTGCRAPVWKGEEIVCIDMDVVHATCCVCQECGLTADRDPYGSDGWKQIGGIVVCADCLARDPTIGQPPSAAPVSASNKVQPEPSPYGSSKAAAAPPTPDYEVCGTCRLSIMNPSEIVTHPKLKGSHHARCLTCQHCNRGIDESFGPSNPVHVRQSRPLCHPCYLVTLPRCGGCKNVITRDTRVCAALGRKYHPQCFVCAKCSTSFPDKSFYVLKDQPYCRQCYHEENGTICGGCQQPIEGPCACVVEGRFHPNCFACATCRDPLTDVYYSYEGRPYCEVHILELQRRRGGKAERRQTYYRNM
ncbi:hypothetical protein BCR44DRAFT_127235 [Catenaria anguillulae PL171]|uniref:LIM zinc-binding domain-containing protein n=1 Tax=Catenaria anguillulae PL171 TaxID=765915 RepID=A0A1Y2HKM6_9FUNG|nr:hypothetical protein BCR44DRAFT_127235 [Catenaria anguillulae PL171]